MDKRYQIFISSTYSDLKVERDAFIHALWCSKYIAVTMEQFPATDDARRSVERRQNFFSPREEFRCNLAVGRRGVLLHLSGMACSNDRRRHFLPAQNPSKCKLGQ